MSRRHAIESGAHAFILNRCVNSFQQHSYHNVGRQDSQLIRTFSILLEWRPCIQLSSYGTRDILSEEQNRGIVSQLMLNVRHPCGLLSRIYNYT